MSKLTMTEGLLASFSVITHYFQTLLSPPKDVTGTDTEATFGSLATHNLYEITGTGLTYGEVDGTDVLIDGTLQSVTVSLRFGYTVSITDLSKDISSLTAAAADGAEALAARVLDGDWELHGNSTSTPELPAGLEFLGNDRVWLYYGNDHFRAGPGPDLVHGGARNDTLLGGTGNDSLFGGNNNDWLLGEDGSDMLVGGHGADMIIGGRGDDDLRGSEGRDTLEGGGGRDVLRGRKHDDLLDGGAGPDRLFGGSGNDTLTGGSGADSFLFFPEQGDDVVEDFMPGIDHLVFRNGSFVEIAGDTDTGVAIETPGGSVTLLGVFEDDLQPEDVTAFDVT